MADIPNGLEALNQRLERRSRSVPPPRRPREAQKDKEPTAAASDQQDAVVEPGSVAEPKVTPPPRRSPKPRTSGRSAAAISDRPTPAANEPISNLAVRVRRSLDTRLGDLVHALKRDGVRVSKTELIEMLLWELPAEVSPEFRRRLAVFREAAPREDNL